MISINYETTKRLAFEKTKGYWRCQAKNQIDNKILQGHSYLRKLKSVLSIQKIKKDKALFIQKIKCSSNELNKDSNKTNSRNEPRNKTFGNVFITSALSNSNYYYNYDKQIFRSEEEKQIYHPIEICPFIITKTKSYSFKQLLKSINQTKLHQRKAIIQKRVLSNSNSVSQTQYSALSQSYSQLSNNRRPISCLNNNILFKIKS